MEHLTDGKAGVSVGVGCAIQDELPDLFGGNDLMSEVQRS